MGSLESTGPTLSQPAPGHDGVSSLAALRRKVAALQPTSPLPPSSFLRPLPSLARWLAVVGRASGGGGAEVLALEVSSKAGLLCEVVQWKGEQLTNGLPELSEKERAEAAKAMANVAIAIIRLADHCGVDLPRAILAKMRLNAQKYPAHLVRGKSSKYDAYSGETSWSRGKEQETEMRHATHTLEWMPQVSLEEVRGRLQEFVAERDWARFHSPRNLVLAMCGEVGELCESVANLRNTGWSGKARDGLAQELSDVMIYLTRLADVCGFNLTSEIEASCCLLHQQHMGLLQAATASGKKGVEGSAAAAAATGGSGVPVLVTAVVVVLLLTTVVGAAATSTVRGGAAAATSSRA